MQNKVSSIEATAALTKLVLGSTLTLFPFIFSKYGIVLTSLVIVILGGFCSGLALYLIMRCSERLKVYRYEEMGEVLCGRLTKIIIEASLFLIGAISLVVFIYTSSPLLAETLNISLLKAQIAISIICTILSCVFQNIESLGFLNVAGMAAVLSLAVTSVYESLGKKDFLALNYFSFDRSLFSKIGFISLCFCSHFLVIPILRPLRNRSDINPIVFASTALAVLFYLIIGICGYIASPKTKENWMTNKFSNKKAALLVRISLVCVDIFSFPVCILPVRKVIHSGLMKITPVKRSKLVDGIVTCLISGASLSVTVMLDDLDIINIFFHCFGPLIMFIYPSLFFFRLFKKEPVGVLIWILALLNFIIGISLIGVSVKLLIERLYK